MNNPILDDFEARLDAMQARVERAIQLGKERGMDVSQLTLAQAENLLLEAA